MNTQQEKDKDEVFNKIRDSLVCNVAPNELWFADRSRKRSYFQYGQPTSGARGGYQHSRPAVVAMGNYRDVHSVPVGDNRTNEAESSGVGYLRDFIYGFLLVGIAGWLGSYQIEQIEKQEVISAQMAVISERAFLLSGEIEEVQEEVESHLSRHREDLDVAGEERRGLMLSVSSLSAQMSYASSILEGLMWGQESAPSKPAPTGDQENQKSPE